MPTLTDEFCEIIKQIKADHSHLRIIQIMHNAIMDNEAYYKSDEELIEKMKLYAHNLNVEKEFEESESLSES